jgi:hypothetical protein
MDPKLLNFVGALLVMLIGFTMFFMLMFNEMPQSNRELLIAFVSALFGAVSASLKKITGDGEETKNP